jgi:hypothetical protein
LSRLSIRDNQFNKKIKKIISKYPNDDILGCAQELLRALQNAYLIPTDNSYVLK